MMDKPVPCVSELTAPYWQGAAAHELRVQRCGQCERRFLYAHAWCPHCWAPDPEWVKVTGLATVVAATVVHQAPYEAFAADVPYAVVIVRLDEGPRMMANVVGCAPERVRIGMRVEVVFEARAEVTIPQFRPAGPQ
jgi:uncharacterized protein